MKAYWSITMISPRVPVVMSNINIDASSLFFVRNLASTNNSIAKTMQRMSTGLRINQAADDAAGLSLSEKITTNINALEGYYRNSQDGLSYLQIADSALKSIGDDLQRMRDLALQGANGIYSAAERTALQDEINERIKDINQVKESTSFSKKEVFEKEQHNYSAKVVAIGDTANITINADQATIIVRDSGGSVIDPADYSITPNAGDGYISISTSGLGGQADFSIEYSAIGDVKTRITTEVEVLKGGLQAEVPAGYTAITNATELANIAGDLTGNYILMNDIDLSSVSNWSRLGNTLTGFSGILDGNGFEISGLTINEPALSFQGLFGNIDGGEVRNLGITNANVIGRGSTAIISGEIENGAIIENCYAQGVVNGKDSSAGLIGIVDNSEVKNSYFNGTVQGKNYSGGFVGYLRNSSTIDNCYANATVTGEAGSNSVGAMVGFAATSSSILNSYSSGSASSSDRAGGFAGWLNNVTVTNCYTTASVYSDDRTGGFVGEAFNTDFNYVYSASDNISGAGDIGSFAGAYNSNCNEVETYTNITQSKIADIVGDSDPNDINAITDEQMKDSSTFATWNSSKWLTDNINYPMLLGSPKFIYGEASYGNLVDFNQTTKKVDSTINTASVNTSLTQYELDQNQDVFNTKVILDADTDKVFVEGVDYTISKDSGSNYLNIINTELLGVNITLEYESAYDNLNEISTHQDGALMLKIDDNFDLGVQLDTFNLDLSGRLNLNLTTAGDSRVAMAVLDENLKYINEKRATIGAKMNALRASIENNRASKEALTSTRTTIRDADFAKEVAKLSQKQVMQEFNVSIYKNMMSTSQGIYLSLLQGVG